MKIAICDCDREFSASLKNSVYQYSNRHRLDILITEFYSGVSLLNSGYDFDLVFLEFETGKLNGLETAKLLRQGSKKFDIIFVSAYTDFIFDSFRVNPFRFLIKPLSVEILDNTLNEYFEKRGTDYPLWIKHNDGIECLNTSEILYLEADNKHCFVNLRRSRLPCHKTMAKVYEALPKGHFVKVSRAFVVNINHITSFSNDYVSLENGERVRISRKYLKNFKTEYRSYINPRNP